MSIYHKAVLDSLPPATLETKTTKAYLLDYDQTRQQGQYLWAFLTNPQTLEFERSAKYSEAQTLSSKKSDWQYSYTTGRSLTINDIILDSWCKGKTIQPLLDGVEALLECDVSKKQYSKRILSFVFGSRRFSPCVLTNVKWTETGWLGGAAARATMSLTLQEVPEPMTRAQAESRKQQTGTAAAAAKQAAGMPRMQLTERQQSEGSKKAIDILRKNEARFNPQVRSLIRSSAYRLLTNRETGDIVLFDRKGQKVGLVGRYNGQTLQVTDVSTLLKK